MHWVLVAFCLGQGRQKQRCQNGDDGDHHEQFDQGEGTIGGAMGETALSAWVRSGGIHRMAILFRCLRQTQTAGEDRKTLRARLKKLLVIRGVRMSAFMNVASQFKYPFLHAPFPGLFCQTSSADYLWSRKYSAVRVMGSVSCHCPPFGCGAGVSAGCQAPRERLVLESRV